MRRRRAVPEAIGLSVLDLVCGLFGLLVVLYATTERFDGAPGVLSEDLKFVRIQLDGTVDSRMGLEIHVGGETIRSWPDCINAGPITWGKCEDGVIEAMVESDAPIEALGFLALSHPLKNGLPTFDSLQVWVSAPNASQMCQIGFLEQYRGVTGSSTCNEL